MSTKRRASNVPSILLNESENEQLFNILGRSCLTLASGVCQLYTADAPSRQRWCKRNTGVVCFVKDNPKRSYFIRLYDIKKDALIWEQEIYNQFKYKAPREYFHTFEADSVQAGLNFASEDEAAKFKSAVEQKLLERHQKKLERKKQQSVGASNNQNAAQVVNTNPQTNVQVTTVDIKSGGNNTIGKSKGKKDKKKKLTKDDISTPTAFRHVSHVGWDPTKGFDMNNLDSDMKTLFEQVGINNTTDIDKDTVDFIYDFVEQHGGIQKIKEEMKQKPPPRAPVGSAPPQPPPPRSAVPPPPPQRGPAPPSRAPPPPSRSQPPPPTPSRQMGAPPAPPSFTPPSMGAPPPPPGAGVPPPPPPPAPPAAPPPPAAPMAPPGMPSGGAGRGALLESIRGGTQLKPAGEGPSRGSGGSGGGGGGDARGNLMEAIRSGRTLNKVERDEKASSDDGAQEQGGIVGALAMALANRQKILQVSEDEDDDSISDDDDWDD